MSAAHLQFDHRVEVLMGGVVDLTPLGETMPVTGFKTDAGRTLRVVRLPGLHATFEVIDDQSRQRCRVDLLGVFERIARDLLEEVGAGDASSDPEEPVKSENPAPQEAIL